jgi:hypothetical protein
MAVAGRIVKIFGSLVALGAIGAGAFLYITRPQPHPASFWEGAGTPDVANGALVFSMGGCVSCHKAPNATGDAELVLARSENSTFPTSPPMRRRASGPGRSRSSAMH